MPAGKRTSSGLDGGKLQSTHETWVPAIPLCLECMPEEHVSARICQSGINVVRLYVLRQVLIGHDCNLAGLSNRIQQFFRRYVI
jgi:hypothetical protein